MSFFPGKHFNCPHCGNVLWNPILRLRKVFAESAKPIVGEVKWENASCAICGGNIYETIKELDKM